jgi:hypothetical protein
MKSTDTLSKAAVAMATARRASAAEWLRPRKFSAASSKDCTPSDSRFTPAFAKAANLSASASVGLASSVTSTAPSVGQSRRTPSMIRRTQAGCISDGVPPPKNTEESLRGPIRSACLSRSFRMASASVACSVWPRSRTTLKSQ